MTHPDAPLESQLALQMALCQLSDKDMTSFWYIHMTPNIIQIEGTMMQRMFQGKMVFVPSIIDAILRLYTQIDSMLYLRWNEKRWRHFLPTDFALWAFSKEKAEQAVLVDEVFYGGYIEYQVEDCRLVIAPLLVESCWCIYIWDFERKKIVVVDPIGMRLSISALEAKHNFSVMLMNSGMNECWVKFANKNEKNMESWETEYINLIGGEPDSMDTGLYAMFYAKYFDGEFMTRVLTKEATQMQRMNLMYQLLKMDGNIGKLPQSISKAVDECI